MVQSDQWSVTPMQRLGVPVLENHNQFRRRRLSQLRNGRREEEGGRKAKRKRKRGATTSKDDKDENREVVNVKPKDLDLDVQEDDDQDAEEPPPKAASERPLAADVQETPVEKPKGVVLKSAADPAVKEKADALLGKETAGEKAPHPQVGHAAAEKAPKEESIEDPYAKAPHGDSSEDDEVLEAQLRSLSEIAQPRPTSDARSDKAACDEEEHRSVPSSSPVKRDKKKKRAGKATDAQSAMGR